MSESVNQSWEKVRRDSRSYHVHCEKKISTNLIDHRGLAAMNLPLLLASNASLQLLGGGNVRGGHHT